MSGPQVTSVAPASPAERAGLHAGDELVSVNGQVPRDILDYQRLVDVGRVKLEIRRPGATSPTSVEVDAEAGEPLGIQVSSPVFDRIRTCDNHCAFCFIYQLPKGMRRSLYVKDDDYRLSFLYGNFTTLTRFTELDVERVLEERLGPLFVSIHATDPEVRAAMLRNPKGGTSLRWLRVLLEKGVEIHGQIVVCPGVNDGVVLENTFADILEEYSTLASVGVVPLGVSDHSHEATMRPHTVDEVRAVCDTVGRWQRVFASVLGRRMAYLADEYYLLAGREMPTSEEYDGFVQHENGIGMARAFEASFHDPTFEVNGIRHGFFASVDGAPAAGYRATRVVTEESAPNPKHAHSSTSPIAILTGAYGARVLAPLVEGLGRDDVTVHTVENRFFGGNIGVTGLLVGADIIDALAGIDADSRVLLPDACLSEGKFLDGVEIGELPRHVEVVATDGAALRRALCVS